MYLQDGLTNRWGTAELSYRGVSGTGGNADGDADSDAGSFISLPYTGYRHHIGGGKPTLTMVSPMQHVGTLTCTEQDTRFHRPVRQGGGEEAPMAGRGLSEEEYGEGLPGLWTITRNGHII